MDVLHVLTNIVSICGGIFAVLLAATKHKKLSVRLSGHFLVAVATVVILGYVFGAPQVYTFPLGSTGVALPTAICFWVTGINFVLLSNGPLK